MGFFDKLFGGKAEQEETAKFFGQSKTVLTPIRGKIGRASCRERV